jgi:chemotaxis protein MotB
LAAERRRRNQDTKKENNERWVISYADFMTLLLATFVVLYAVSSINVSRYRAAAEALSAVFTGKVIVPDKGDGSNPSGFFENQPAPIPKPVVKLNEPQKGVPNVSEKIRERIAKLDQAYKNLSHLLQDVIDKGQVHIARNGLSVTIDISASVLFDSGKADLTTSALGVIDQIGVVLKDQPYSIQVNGYTDNAPIHTTQFGSNWELSAMRAISVVRRFVSDGVDPSRLVGAGYGEYHPIASNEDAEGKAKNRRVSIVVVSAGSDDKSGGSEPGAPAPSTTSTGPVNHIDEPSTTPVGKDRGLVPPLSVTPAKPISGAPSAPAVPPPTTFVVPSPASSLSPTQPIKPVAVPSIALPPRVSITPVLKQTQLPVVPDQPH